MAEAHVDYIHHCVAQGSQNVSPVHGYRIVEIVVVDMSRWIVVSHRVLAGFPCNNFLQFLELH